MNTIRRVYSRLLRARLAVSRWARALAARVTSPFADTQRPGIAIGGRVRDHQAEVSLARLAQSPAIFAAITRRALGMQRFPLVVYEAEPGGRNYRPLNPAQVPWVATCLRLLQRPDPADAVRSFPRIPGEYFLAQLLADYLLTGNAYVRIQRGSKNTIVGLSRLHPASVTLEWQQGALHYLYTPPGASAQRFADYDVVHLHSLPWRRDVGDQLGTGAGTPLAAVVDAEVAALMRTTTAIQQGGVDVAVEATNDTAAAWLMAPENREELKKELTETLADAGSRVAVPGGGIKLEPLGLTPADVKAPELLALARKLELLAIGVVPVAVGDPDGATYATAAAQLRVQYGLDLELAEALSFWLLRPLAQVFAASDPSWVGRIGNVTCGYDLATHEGALAARGEALSRMQTLVQLGWTAAQAAAIEGLDLPAPLGTPMMVPVAAGAPPASAPRPAPAQTGGEPAAPVGEQPTRDALPWMRRRTPETDLEERALAWRAIEDGRSESDQSLRTASSQALGQDHERLRLDLEQLLRGAWDGTAYGPIDWTQLTAAPELYDASISAPWRTTWTGAVEGALPPEVASSPTWDGQPEAARQLGEGTAAMARTSREQTYNLAESLVREGQPPSSILDEMDQASTWSESRALSIARTETVRAQTLGTDARFSRAASEGVQLEEEWLSARDSEVRDHHRALDGKRVPVGGSWTFPNGTSTRGPGLSGRPEEDCNCRCAKRAKLL